jgi:hypothetical protein
LVAIASLASASCELSSGLLSESERSSLYTVKLKSGDAALDNGSFIQAGSSVVAEVTKLSGAEDIAFLDMGLSGTEISERLAGPAAKAAAKGSKAVSSIEGAMPPLELPSSLEPGAYSLTLQLSSADGKSLQKTSVLVFVGLTMPKVESVSLYPPSVEPGQGILLGVSLDTATGAADPWIRWSRDGVSFAAGLLSEGADRVVWTAPRAEGAYSLSVEAFPCAPPAGSTYAFRSTSRQDLKAMVKATTGGSADEFSDPLAFLSLLRLDGSFDDSGVRSRAEGPAPFGSPSLDVYPGGFGYSFGASAGVRIPGLMPPTFQGSSVPFSAVFRLAPQSSSGYLLRFASTDAAYLLELGLDEGKPYATLRVGDAEFRSLAAVALTSAPHTLVATIRPGATETLVTWNVDGARVDAPSLLPLPNPPAGSAIIGGSGSLPGVYDAFGLMGATGPSRPIAPPSYRLASRRSFKSSIAIAEGFEEGILPPGAVATGNATASYGAILLAEGASVDFGSVSKLDKPLRAEADLVGEAARFSLAFKDKAGKQLFSVGGGGDVFDGEGRLRGRIPAAEGRLAFIVVPGRGGFAVSAPDGRDGVAIEAENPLIPFSISALASAGGDPIALSRLLARDSSDTLL